MKTLDWKELRIIGITDKQGRYYPKNEVAVAYIEQNGYRSPSRSWPLSYAKPLMTKKFAKWALENHKEFANKLGITGD